MKVKVCSNNSQVIEGKLRAVNGTASKFTITSFEKVRNVSVEAEDRLKLVNKNNRHGTMAVYTPNGPYSNGYKYSPFSTRITLKRGAKDWYLIKVERVEVSPRQKEHLKLIISQQAFDDIVRHATEGMEVGK